MVTGTIDYGSDIDYFNITATGNGEMRLDLNSSFAHRMWVYLYDSNGGRQVLNDTYSSYTGDFTFDVTEGVTYTVSISAASDSTVSGAYTLDITTDIPTPPPTPDPIPDGEITPGETIYAGVWVDGDGLSNFLVVGTDSADDIVVEQSGSVMTLVLGQTRYEYSGDFNSVLIFGFGGNDMLRTDWSVTTDTIIYGGDGNDVIYENGQASATVLGEAGDDRLITVGGGNDDLHGGTGFDSFWLDSSDQVADTEAAEVTGRTVHQITSFYQPWTSDTTSGDYISLEIFGQNFRDPTATSSATGWRNYADSDLFNDGADYNDINQGALGDCYFLAGLSSLSDTDQNLVEQMVTDLGDGTYAVRFYRNGQEVYLRVDADLPAYYSGLAYAQTSETGEIWVAIAEKAYAHFRYNQDTYDSIQGGWMDVVYEQVTGVSAGYQYTSSMTTSTLASTIRNHLASGHALSLGSYYDASNPIVGLHAYQIHSIDNDNYVTVYNPWGVDGRSWDSNYYDGLIRLSIDQIRANFSALCVSYA
jgi:hypothetical protein